MKTPLSSVEQNERYAPVKKLEGQKCFAIKYSSKNNMAVVCCTANGSVELSGSRVIVYDGEKVFFEAPAESVHFEETPDGILIKSCSSKDVIELCTSPETAG